MTNSKPLVQGEGASVPDQALAKAEPVSRLGPSGFDPSRKVVVNRCFGGFGLSDAGIRLYAKLKGLTLYPEKDDKFSFTTYWTVPPEDRQAEPSQEEWLSWTPERRQEHLRIEKEQEISAREIPRDDPALVETVETLGASASDTFAQLVVVEIPADVKWQIEEYDGREHIAEAHRTW
jgi:hypothetical protein